jgi:hypothetical protein
VRSWTPNAGPIQGYLITHNESISIADYLTIEEDGEAVYRPTVHYAYHPSDDTILSLHELQGRNLRHPDSIRVMDDEIVDGMDELGVLLYGHAKNAYWYGSQLTIHEARSLAPYQNATGLQVSSAVVAGMIWAIENPTARRRRRRRARPRSHPRDPGAVPRQAGRRVHRLDAARQPRRPVPRGHRSRRSVAVPQRDRALTPQHTSGSVRIRRRRLLTA